MKVTVDPVACEANAVCVRLVPQLFSIHEDEDGEDVLAIANDGEVTAELAAGVRDAVTRCPKMALSAELELCPSRGTDKVPAWLWPRGPLPAARGPQLPGRVLRVGG
jgi:ferredoxin